MAGVEMNAIHPPSAASNSRASTSRVREIALDQTVSGRTLPVKSEPRAAPAT